MKDGVKDFGHWAKVRVFKNHSGPTHKRDFRLRLRYGYGFETAYDLVDTAIDLGVLKPAGAWYSIGDEKVQGKENVYDLVSQKEETGRTLWSMINERLHGEAPVAMPGTLGLIPGTDQVGFIDNEGDEVELAMTPEEAAQYTGEDE